MTPSRRLRRLVCQWLVGVLLGSQFAVAVYACSVGLAPLSGTIVDSKQVTLDAATGSTDRFKTALAAEVESGAGPSLLCSEHCKAEHKANESARTPMSLPATLPTSLVYWQPAMPEPERTVAELGFNTDAAMAPPPPHALIHCVLRL